MFSVDELGARLSPLATLCSASSARQKVGRGFLGNLEAASDIAVRTSASLSVSSMVASLKSYPPPLRRVRGR
jgi:hypothetical protein